MNLQELKKAGWKIDDTVYPHFAYRGPRFRPTAHMTVPTEKERELQEEVLRLRMEVARLKEFSRGTND